MEKGEEGKELEGKGREGKNEQKKVGRMDVVEESMKEGEGRKRNLLVDE